MSEPEDPIASLPALDRTPWIEEAAARLAQARAAMRATGAVTNVALRRAAGGGVEASWQPMSHAPDSAHGRMALSAAAHRFEAAVRSLGDAPAWLHPDGLATVELCTDDPFFARILIGTGQFLLEEPDVADALHRAARVAAAGVRCPPRPGVERHRWPEWTVHLFGSEDGAIGPITSIACDSHTNRCQLGSDAPALHVFTLRADGPAEALRRIGWVAAVNGALRGRRAAFVARVARSPDPAAEDRTEEALAALAASTDPTARLAAAVLRRGAAG